MIHITHILFIFTALLALFSVISAQIALLAGIVFALLGWVPTHLPLSKWAKQLLATSIVLLGFSVHIQEAGNLLYNNIFIVTSSIGVAFLSCFILARLMGIDRDLGSLIGTGTAICGGSAIAAVSPVIRAKSATIAIALGCVFFLNAAALWLFPSIGKALNLSQTQFGVWAALAIHDTASVVAAAGVYGESAQTTATTLKLARALAIIPVVIVFAWIMKRKGASAGESQGVYFPWFISGFVIAAIISSLLPSFAATYDWLAWGGKKIMALCIFLIGAGLTPALLKQTGWRALVVAVGAWVSVSVFALWWVVTQVPG
ncbi:MULTISPECIES: YeiH family protein [Gammaproteobacteria]|uniref:YeiH family protein n=1 Tax=Gammaproteobacteria TaxID=1236 RepID=UPI000DD04330|nr:MULTISPECIES: putative sulfate exporter family transporter [Gammaproteobacteria]RTE86628.1 putative sulfate exporter family transporter [Aliidiomarina sp. B3213]TCZ90817.1 putative sulfate exporter family transporter [Lysobacter sp. N42]